MQRYTFLFLQTALHVSGGSPAHHQEHNTVFAASGICLTVTATCRNRGRAGVTTLQRQRQVAVTI